MDVVTRRDRRRDVMMVGPFARQISSDVASCILLQVACHTIEQFAAVKNVPRSLSERER